MGTTDLVLEGGGVKGAGLAGAVQRLAEDHAFHRVAGTSAGAIVAGLVAAGLEHRLEEWTVDVDLTRFLDGGRAGRRLGRVGRWLDLALAEGMYSGVALHRWLEATLADAGVRTFGDLRLPGTTRHTCVESRYGLVVMVSDISRGRLLRLPWDAEPLLGIDPDSLGVADTIRASASIPFFYRPWRLPVDPRKAHGHTEILATDGGLLSNFPIGIFDGEPARPTIGVRLSARTAAAEGHWHHPRDPLSMARALVATMTNAHDLRVAELPSVVDRTVFVDTDGISSTDFRITSEQRRALHANGYAAADAFLAGVEPSTAPPSASLRGVVAPRMGAVA